MVQKRDVPGIRKYDAPAGGWGALKATAIAIRDQMDVVEAPLTLLHMNKPDGFDCPGCAWPDKEHTSTFQLCENEGRLTHPMVYDPGTDTYQPIEWDEAFALIGERLRSLGDPNMAEFYTSG